MKFVFFMLILGTFFLGGCQSSLENKIWDNIAEVRQFMLLGQDEGISATLTCGMREIDYKINGYATEVIEFGVITICLDDIDNIVYDKAEFVMFVGTKKYDGTLQLNPFDNTLVADIKEIVGKTQNITLEIYLDDERSYVLKLKPIDNEWAITYDDCVKIFINKYKAELKSLISNGELEGEVYIKILNDYDGYANDFYYYVSLVGRKGEKISIIVCPDTGNILASSCTGITKT